MSEYKKEKLYWLRLERDFFKRAEIKIIENLPDGKEYILLYLKLLVESIEYAGKLRLNVAVPYDVGMIATITNTEKEIVEKALQVFTDYKMIEVMDDKTIFMAEIKSMLEGTTVGAVKKKEQRYNKKKTDSEQTPSGQMSAKTDEADKCPPEIEIEKEIEKSKSCFLLSENSAEKNENENNKLFFNKSNFKKPTVKEVLEYITEKGYTISANKFYSYYEAKDWQLNSTTKMQEWKAAVDFWAEKENEKNALPKGQAYTERKYSKEELDNMFDDLDKIEF